METQKVCKKNICHGCMVWIEKSVTRYQCSESVTLVTDFSIHTIHTLKILIFLGPVVQSIVSLKSSLRGQLVNYDFITKYIDMFC